VAPDGGGLKHGAAAAQTRGGQTRRPRTRGGGGSDAGWPDKAGQRWLGREPNETARALGSLGRGVAVARADWGGAAVAREGGDSGRDGAGTDGGETAGVGGEAGWRGGGGGGRIGRGGGGSEEENTRKMRPLVIFPWRLRTLTKMKGPSILPTNLHF
jgi:hypothetical protein